MRRALRAGSHLLFVALALGCAGLVVLNVMAWRGTLVDEAEPELVSSQATVAAPALADPPPDRAVARPAAVSLDIRATKGPCWLVVREGGPSGRLRYEGTLARGRALHFEDDRRMWLRLGAAANVRVEVDGTVVKNVPGGTVDLVATHSGAQVA